MALEEERKYEADAAFVLPELVERLPSGSRVVDREPVTLTATYYDTDDLRLARAGVSLRYRRADEPPWTVKLPAGVPGVRQEVGRSGRAGSPPDELVRLVAAYTRGAPVVAAVKIRSRRRAYELRDHSDAVLAEVADDEVAVLDGRQVQRRFREIEVERAEGPRALLDRIGAALADAGAVAGDFTPKHVRALGAPASAPPDLPPPGALGPSPSAGDVVTEAIRAAADRIVRHDPLLRLRQNLPGGDTPVHQIRVGCRRLRSDLRTFGSLVDERWARWLRRELRWLARTLGAARDAEVLRERLRRTAGSDPLAPPDPAAVARLDDMLAARQDAALAELHAAVDSDRYVSLLDALVDAATRPPLTGAAATPAREILPRLVAQPWRLLAYGERGVDGATDLAADAPDADWHAVRVHGKQARYAVEAVAGIVGGRAPKLARRLAAVQDLLGRHQDAAVAAGTWVDLAGSDPDDHMLAVTAGRLYERERAAVRRARKKFPAAWRAASRRKLVSWLP